MRAEAEYYKVSISNLEVYIIIQKNAKIIIIIIIYLGPQPKRVQSIYCATSESG